MDKNLLRYPGSKKVMAMIGLLTVAQSLAILIQAIFLAKAITQMFQGQTPWSDIINSFVIFVIAHTMRHFLQWSKDRIAYHFAEKTALNLQEQLMEKMFELGPRAVGKHGSGNLITLALEGMPKFSKYLELSIPRMLAMGITPVILLMYIFTADVMSGVTLLVVMPILIIFLILVGLVTKKKTDDQMETYRLLSRHFLDSLRGLLTLKYLGRSKAHEKAIATVSNKYRIATNRSLRYAFLSAFSLDFFSSLSVALVAVELGLRLINGTVMLEPALTILILAPEYFLPVRELGNDFHATLDGKDAAEQMHKIIDEKTKKEDFSVPTIPPWTATTKLAIHGLQSTTDEGRVNLENIHLELIGFQKVGIVGSSGAGKSTFIDLLSGFTIPSAGEMIINGQSYPHLSTPTWQQQVTYIPQHPTIFSATVAENIRMYHPNASDQEVQKAAERAGLTELVSSFPNGYDEKIGQGGRTLSGGEEQRIAVARSILQNRPILLLDEPTAHLDIETEHEMKQLLLPLLKDKLVFLATHRLHWMEQMDTILVLQAGQIVERGTHEVLLQKRGVYYDMMMAQRRGIKE